MSLDPTMNADQLLTELDRRSTDLADAVDPVRRKADLGVILQPFQPGQMYSYVPLKEGVEPATQKFIAEEDLQAGYKLFHLEDFVRHAEPVAASLEERERHPPTAEQCLAMRAGRVGLSLGDHLEVQILEELRIMRLTPMVQTASASEQLSALEAAAADPTETYNGTVLRMMEGTHLNGFSGPKPDSAEDLKAAQLLRKRLIEMREARVSESTRKLKARIAEAKRQITKAKMLHRLHPANPEHPGAAKER